MTWSWRIKLENSKDLKLTNTRDFSCLFSVMLLDSFPYEIVEEIFLYLPPSDRISTVKVNRWLNSIGRSKRLAVRHTLDGTIASMWLTLKTNTFFIERTNVEGDHPPVSFHNFTTNNQFCMNFINNLYVGNSKSKIITEIRYLCWAFSIILRKLDLN